MAVKLEELLAHPVLKKYRPTIILGGPGAWQLVVNPEKRKRLGIDCVVVGEGESIAPRLFRQAMERPGSLPAVVEGEIAGDGDIPDIVGGTICGILEATRGCARRCAFCVPSLKKVRSRPLENILREVQVNVRAGNPGIILHGEDILLYGSDGLKVNGPAVVELFSRVSSAPGVKWVTASHASLSSAMSSPETVREISRALGLGTPLHPTKAFQVGIETGSPRLIKRHMRGKVYPFEPAEWPDVVKGAFQLFHSSHIVCCSTLILGLPGEEPDDVHRTLDLVRAHSWKTHLRSPKKTSHPTTTR
jgi:radical SAM superfamily enzyme YgiQ (UPF0313 family)